MLNHDIDKNDEDGLDYNEVYGEDDESNYEAQFDDQGNGEGGALFDQEHIARRSADPEYIIRPSGDGMYGPDGEPRLTPVGWF